MKPENRRRTLFGASFIAVVAVLCVASLSRNAVGASGGSLRKGGRLNVDFDFTRMNPTVRTTYSFRLAADPTEFTGRVIRVSGKFLTRVDMDDGKRYFGCLLGDPGGCSCCAPGNVLEFMPKDIYAWPTNFPPSESRITVTGRLKMAEVGPQGQTFSIPRLVEADMEWMQKR